MDQHYPKLKMMKTLSEDVKSSPNVKDATHVTSLTKTSDQNWNTLNDIYNTRYTIQLLFMYLWVLLTYSMTSTILDTLLVGILI